MKLALICPSNILYMPYLNNYMKILDKEKIQYTVIYWDRLDIITEKKTGYFSYRDNKNGHRRSFSDYYKYKKYILGILKTNNFDKIIVFGIQLTYFLKKYLLNNYRDKYVVDIRDYHKLLKLFNIKNIISNSFFTTISSPGYLAWLPSNEKIIVNHNTSISSVSQLIPLKKQNADNLIKISYIGILTNLNINLKLIKLFKDEENFLLTFQGDGVINQEIKTFVKKNDIQNVIVGGRYQKNDELKIYGQTDFVNMLLEDNNINNKTCLSNRLYNSVIAGKPMIALENTYLSSLIKQYNLGLVLNSLEDTPEKLIEFKRNINEKKYNEGRIAFINNVINCNEKFAVLLTDFAKDKINSNYDS